MKTSQSFLAMFSPMNFLKCLTGNNDSNVNLSLFLFSYFSCNSPDPFSYAECHSLNLKKIKHT